VNVAQVRSPPSRPRDSARPRTTPPWAEAPVPDKLALPEVEHCSCTDKCLKRARRGSERLPPSGKRRIKHRPIGETRIEMYL